MNASDENAIIVDPSTVPPWPTITRFGLIGGLSLIILSLVGILTGLSSPANWVSAIIFLLVVIAFYVVLMVMAVKSDRDDNLGGHIKLGRAFMVAFFTACIVALLGTVFNVIYMGIIDPDYMMRVGDDLRGLYEKMGLNEEQIEQAIIDAGADSRQTIASAAKSQVSTFISGAVVGAIIALIIAASMKKDAPRMA
jgi:phosphatidylglycerophosphate synthase